MCSCITDKVCGAGGGGKADLTASNVITWSVHYGNEAAMEEALAGSRGG